VNVAPLFPDDPQALPEGSVVDCSTSPGDMQEHADYVVIGSGAAGATAALVLASAGHSVIVVEEGDWVRTPEFSEDLYPAMKRLFRDAGTNMAFGRSMLPVIQGRCVGGSTTINSAISWRAPESVLVRWQRQFGLGGSLGLRDLVPHFEELERSLRVRPVSNEVFGRSNEIFRDSARAFGVRAEPMRRYDGGCVASSGCLSGCRAGKKQSMNLTHIPRALQLGARIFTSARVEAVQVRFGRATGIRARIGPQGTSTLRLAAARGVIVAASAVQTPGLLRRSGVRAPALGRHFQTHPATGVLGVFERPVSMDFGATQGFNSTHFADSDRVKLEVASIPIEMVCARVPELGEPLMRRLSNYGHLANWAVLLRSEAEGHVTSWFGKDQVHFTPTPADMSRIRNGLRVLSEMLFLAGAREVIPNIHGLPNLKSAADLALWDTAPTDPRAYQMVATHLFGTARMGPDPRSSVVGLDFQVHGVRGLYVVDSSILPTNLGVNPQHTIMAMARLAASRMAEAPLRRAA
jgi:choline dehydrogenase-like flavoprotein